MSVAVVVAAATVGASSYALGKDHATPAGSVILYDATGKLSVTVPAAWEKYVARTGWVPPGQPGGAHERYPSLWAGSAESWTDLDSSDRGVFVGVLPSAQLPGQLPHHPECGRGDQVVGKDPQGQDQATARYTGCADGVVIEQATMLGAGRLLWVQVRGDTVGQATAVLRTVTAMGGLSRSS